MTVKQISDVINELDYKSAKFKRIQEEFPNAKINNLLQASCRSVNNKFTDLEFHSDSWGLYVFPYYQISFEYQNTVEIVKVYSIPRKNKLVYLTWRRDPISKKRIVKFSRLAFNLKKNKFKEQMLSQCQSKIINFISGISNYHLDTTNLDPRLKNLIGFI